MSQENTNDKLEESGSDEMRASIDAKFE